MTLFDIVSRLSSSDRVTAVKRSSGEILIDAKSAEELMGSQHFHEELADLEVSGLGVGDLCDLVATVE